MKSSEEGSKTKVCVVDVDGTLIDSSERFRISTYKGRINWKKALDPKLIERLDRPMPGHIIEEIVRKCREMCDKVVVLTGRPRRLEDITRRQLEKIGFRYDILIMRDDNDFTEEIVYKLRKLRELARKYEIAAIFDDNIRFLIAVRNMIPHVKLFHVTRERIYELPTIYLWSSNEESTC